MITGWEDPRLMVAFDLIYAVGKSHPGCFKNGEEQDIMDSIERLDDLIRDQGK